MGKLILSLLFIVLLIQTQALVCSLYQYATQTVTCANQCPSQTTNVSNNCLTNQHYLQNGQVYYCPGFSYANFSRCCRVGYFV